MLFTLSKNTIFPLLKQSRRAVLKIFLLAVCWGTLLPITAQGAAMPGPPSRGMAEIPKMQLVARFVKHL